MGCLSAAHRPGLPFSVEDRPIPYPDADDVILCIQKKNQELFNVSILKRPREFQKFSGASDGLPVIREIILLNPVRFEAVRILHGRFLLEDF